MGAQASVTGTGKVCIRAPVRPAGEEVARRRARPNSAGYFQQVALESALALFVEVSWPV